MRWLLGWVVRHFPAPEVVRWEPDRSWNKQGFRQPKRGLWRYDMAQMAPLVPEPPRFSLAPRTVAYLLAGALGWLVAPDWMPWYILPVFGMAQLPIVPGTTANDGTGTNWRTAWQRTHDNFTDLYSLQSQIISAGEERFASLPTKEARISAARVQVAVELKTICAVPATMTPFDAALVDFTNPNVRNVVEGGDYSVYDLRAYGLGGSTTANVAGLQAIFAAITAVGGGDVYGPPGTFTFNAQCLLPANVTIDGSWQCILDFTAVPSLGSQQGVLHASLKDNITIDGVRIDAMESSAVLAFHGCDNVRVNGCRLSQTTTEADYNTAVIGIYDNPTGTGFNSGFWIERNRILGTDNAIAVQGREAPWQLFDVFIDKNSIKQAVSAHTTFGVIKIDIQVYRFEVTRNIINGNGVASDGINIQENVRWGTVTGNTITSMIRNGVLIEDGQSGGVVRDLLLGKNIITNITVVGAECRGINLNYANGGHSENVTISGNILSEIKNEGIKENSTGAIALVIANNSIRQHAAGGVTAAGIQIASANVSVTGNYVQSTTPAASLSAGANASGLVDGNTFLSVNASGNAVADASNGGLIFGTNIGYTPTSTPATFTANQHDFNAAGATWLRCSTDASRNLTGILRAPWPAGAELVVTNVGVNPLVLPHEATGSAATNRFLTNTGASVTLGAGASARVKNDVAASRWRVVV
jgi:hypothetical protein